MKRIVFLLIIVLFLVFSRSSFSLAETKFANDPTRLSVGARVLGLGGSFVGIADDTSAIFINPAGLGNVDTWQISSTSGKYINFYNYSQFSFLYPTRFGTMGLAYGGSAVEFHYPSAEIISIGDEIRYLPTGEVSGKYSNTALLLSFANKFDFLFLKNLGLGVTLKMLFQDLSLNGTSGNGRGMETNFGLLYPFSNDLYLGLALHNALPASLGGKLTWSTNTDETLPALLKTGLCYQLMGEDKEGWRKGRDLKLSLDYDYQLTRKDLPGLFHLGTEWFPTDFVFLRAGVDQNSSVDTSGNLTTVNDLSLGLGFLFRGFRFDYAYHTYDNIAENTTHYFSISYGIWPKKLEVATKEYISIVSPTPGDQVFEKEIEVKGKVEKEVAKVLVQNREAEIVEDTFTVQASLEVGKNVLLVQAFDRSRKLLKQFEIPVVRLQSFKDVSDDYWARKAIGQLATLGVIGGYPDGTFKPEGVITRAELCTLLMKAKIAGQGPQAGSETSDLRLATFKDIAAKHWAAKYIGQAVAEGIVKGYPDGTFQPGKAISRAEAAEVLAKFSDLPEPKLLIAPYTDVPGRHWAVKSIISLKEGGFLDYIKENEFKPKTKMTRAEVAYILARSKYVKNKMKEQWE